MSKVEDLELLYSPSRWSKRFERTVVIDEHIKFLEENSKSVKEKIPSELGLTYGPGPKEKYDIYGTDLNNDSPIVIHIHGGYYQEESLTHSNNGFISNVLYQNGIKTILLGYDLSPKKTVGQILESLKCGLGECIKYARKLKARGIYLSGHSVGAHAIASILTNFKKSIPQEDAFLIKAAFLLCGLYDFVPITKMSANDVLKLTETTAKTELSPLFDKVEYDNTVIYIVAAENDSPAFVQQSKDFYCKLQRDGVESYFNVVPNVDHFDVVEKLYFADFELIKLIVNVINKVSE